MCVCVCVCVCICVCVCVSSCVIFKAENFNMQAFGFNESLVPVYQTTRHHITEESNLDFNAVITLQLMFVPVRLVTAFKLRRAFQCLS